jgi:hypothetical protein
VPPNYEEAWWYRIGSSGAVALVLPFLVAALYRPLAPWAAAASAVAILALSLAVWRPAHRSHHGVGSEDDSRVVTGGTQHGRLSRGWQNAIAVVVVAGALTVVLWNDINAEWHAQDAEREAAAFANSIEIGASHESMTQAFARGRFRYLMGGEQFDDRDWLFHTPYRFGARNWIVIVGFESERVVSVRVGTSDDVHRRPEGAPADRVEQVQR